MILLVTIVLALPSGFFLRNRLSAVVLYVAAYSWAYSFQGVYLVRFWVGGDHSAFPSDPKGWPLAYGLVSASVLLAGIGLVFLGHRLGSRRRTQRLTRAVDPSGLSLPGSSTAGTVPAPTPRADGAVPAESRWISVEGELSPPTKRGPGWWWAWVQPRPAPGSARTSRQE